MVQPFKMLPPDEQQREFAKEVRAKLPTETTVTFYRLENPDGGRCYGVVYQYGSARQNLQSDIPHYDADAMVRGVTAWVASLQGAQRWSRTP